MINAKISYRPIPIIMPKPLRRAAAIPPITASIMKAGIAAMAHLIIKTTMDQNDIRISVTTT